MKPTIGLKFLCVGSSCDVTIRQNHFAVAALFLAGGDKVGYFLNRPCIIHKLLGFSKYLIFLRNLTFELK